jgi:hypothetical protein
VLALVEGLGGKVGLGLEPLGSELGLVGDGLGLLGGGLGLEPLGSELGLVGDGLGLLGVGLGLLGVGLGLLGVGLGLLGGGLGLGLLARLGLVAFGPVVKVAHVVGLGLAVEVALVAELVGGAVARTGCCDAQLAEFGCW